jgi:NTE family protein
LCADAVFGTSAGSFVGTALAAGADIEQLYAAQQAPAVDESTTKASRTLTAAWGWAFLRGRGNPERVGAAFGAVARRFTPRCPRPGPAGRRPSRRPLALNGPTAPQATG